jgi:hypothetical protein
MLHACVERFDVMSGRGNILGWDGEVNKVVCTAERIQEIPAHVTETDDGPSSVGGRQRIGDWSRSALGCSEAQHRFKTNSVFSTTGNTDQI